MRSRASASCRIGLDRFETPSWLACRLLRTISLLSKLDERDRSSMHAVNHVPPERMSTVQRRGEIATILALGLVRLRGAGSTKSASEHRESVLGLGFLGDKNIHGDSKHSEKESL